MSTAKHNPLPLTFAPTRRKRPASSETPCPPNLACPSHRWPSYASFPCTWSPFKNYLAPTAICSSSYVHRPLSLWLANTKLVILVRLQISSLLIWSRRETPSIACFTAGFATCNKAIKPLYSHSERLGAVPHY